MDFLGYLKRGWERLDESWKYSIIIFVAMRLFYMLWSWVVLTITPVAVYEYIGINGEQASIFLSLHESQYFSYYREVSGEILTFRSNNKDTVIDLQTNSVWNIRTGIAMDGPFQGSVLSPAPPPPGNFPYYLGQEPYPNPWLAVWQRFDALWYISIAERGYGAYAGDYAFPPLYPLLIKLLKPIFGSAFLAGLFLSHGATLLAIKLLLDTYASWRDISTARQAVILFIVFPTSFFLFSVYTEPVFLVLTMLSMKFMVNRSWNLAGFGVFLAILTRLQGLALVFPMLYLMWKDRPFLQKYQHWTGLSAAAAGFLFYFLLRASILGIAAKPFSDPVWHAKFVPPWETYYIGLRALLSGAFRYIDLINWGITTLLIILLMIAWRRVPIEYNVYTVVSLFILLSRGIDGQPLLAMSRYALTLFTCFYLLGSVSENPWIRRTIIYIFIALNLSLSAMFFMWGYVA